MGKKQDGSLLFCMMPLSIQVQLYEKDHIINNINDDRLLAISEYHRLDLLLRVNYCYKFLATVSGLKLMYDNTVISLLKLH